MNLIDKIPLLGKYVEIEGEDNEDGNLDGIVQSITPDGMMVRQEQDYVPLQRTILVPWDAKIICIEEVER